MNKTLLLLSALAMLAVPTSSAGSILAQPTPDSIGHVLDSYVSITYTVNPSIEAGDVVPLCDDTPDMPDGQDVLGAVQDGCFQPLDPANSNEGPINICDPVIVNLFPVGVALDEECIENIGEWIQRIVSGDRLPVHVGIPIKK